jgi:hypothetical protein
MSTAKCNVHKIGLMLPKPQIHFNIILLLPPPFKWKFVDYTSYQLSMASMVLFIRALEKLNKLLQ